MVQKFGEVESRDSKCRSKSSIMQQAVTCILVLPSKKEETVLASGQFWSSNYYVVRDNTMFSWNQYTERFSHVNMQGTGQRLRKPWDVAWWKGLEKKKTGITTYTVNILQESHKRRGIQTICYPNHLHFIRILIANYLWAYRQQALSVWVMTFLTVTEKSR